MKASIALVEPGQLDFQISRSKCERHGQHLDRWSRYYLEGNVMNKLVLYFYRKVVLVEQEREFKSAVSSIASHVKLQREA